MRTMSLSFVVSTGIVWICSMNLAIGPVTKVVGPSFTDIANRKYSNEKILELIHNPQPQNWPDFPTPMTPMPQVSTADGLKIAVWINSLAK